MHFYDVAPLDCLLEQMAIEAGIPTIALAATTLLLSSFFPTSEADKSSETGATQIRRCLKFTKLSGAAAEVFYSHLPRVVSVGRAVKFLVMLFTQVFPVDLSSTHNSGEKVGVKQSRAKRDRAALEVLCWLCVRCSFC